MLSLLRERQGIVEPKEKPVVERGLPELYFARTSFIRDAKLISEGIDLPWDEIRNDRFVLMDDEALAFCFAQRVEPETGNESLLYAYHDGENSSGGEVRDVSEGVVSALYELLDETVPMLPQDLRVRVIDSLADKARTLGDATYVAAYSELVVNFIETVPDVSDGVEKDKIREAFDGVGSVNEDARLEKFVEVLELLSRKVSDGEDLINETVTMLYRTEDSLGANLPMVLSGMLKKLANREGFSESRSFVRPVEVLDFTPKELITTPISTKEELRQRLADMSVESFDGRMSSGVRKAEFVDLQDVAGLVNAEAAGLVSYAEGRGLDKIWEFVQHIQGGGAVVGEGIEPITMVEIDGKYYVDSGRHRIMAMKALGIESTPALVLS